MNDPKQPTSAEHEAGGRAVDDETAVIQTGAEAAAEELAEDDGMEDEEEDA